MGQISTPFLQPDSFKQPMKTIDQLIRKADDHMIQMEMI
jgi:hypothetical protein